jgi:hypothetical protein
MCGAAPSAAPVAVRRVALPHHDGGNAYVTAGSNTPANAPLRTPTPGEADDGRDECRGDQQPGEYPRSSVGTGPRRWPRLALVDLPQDVSRDGDVVRGDEHVAGSGGKELRHLEAGARPTTEPTSASRSRPWSSSASISSWAQATLTRSMSVVLRVS